MRVNILSDLYNGFLKIVKYAVTILGSILVIVVFSNVISRYFLHASLAWADETARFLFIWLSFLGAILANATNEHMHLDFVVEKLPKKVGQVVLVLANFAILFILSIVFKGGITVTLENLHWMSPALEISYGLVYSIAPISVAVLILQTIARIFNATKLLFGFTKIEERSVSQ
jgi:TRAP-type transport system small permease protein